MKPAPFDYVAPREIEEALEHLDRGAGDATILAGGQTLVPLLALRMAMPSVLIDINRIAALRGIDCSAAGTVIRPVTRQNHALANVPLGAAQPALIKALSHVGHFQTRNRGTIGGSISLGEPAAEMPAAALALGASVEARSLRGSRRIPLDAFYESPYSNALEPDEMVTAIHYPAQQPGARILFREVARRPGDFALVGLVGSIAVQQGKVTHAGIAWFGMGPTPMKACSAEQALVGQAVADIEPRAIAELAVSDTDPFDDHSAPADYRRAVGRRAFAEALRDTLSAGVVA